MEFREVFVIVFFSLLLLCFLSYMRARRNGKAKESSGNNNGAGQDTRPPKNDQRNGTDDDVTVFANKLMRFARKAKVRLIVPGLLKYDGKTAKVSAIIVGHGNVLGIYCVGYGGNITVPSDAGAANWTQEINGRTKSIPNPWKNCEAVNGEVEDIMQDYGLPVKMRTVPVFTTPKVTFTSMPQNVYTQDTLFYYLDNAEWVKEGTLDMDAIADAMQSMIPMDELKEAEKKRKQGA